MPTSDDGPLRSRESNIRAFVKFINASQRLVEVHWVNFAGENIHYTNLVPGADCVVSWDFTVALTCAETVSWIFQINTYLTHPWIFLCPATGDRLQVEQKNVFTPLAWFKFVNKTENGLVTVGRQEARIHLPLKTLRDICLWRILFLVQTKDDIIKLELPKSLRADLDEVFNQSTRSSVPPANWISNWIKYFEYIFTILRFIY